MGGKTRLQMRTDLASDLKITIDTEISAAELNRCIEKAISDLSRYLPRERTYEESLQFAVPGEEVKMPLDAVSGKVVAVESLTSTVAGNTATIDGQPDVPRPLRINITDDNEGINGLTLIIQGIDEDDIAITEIFHYIKGDDKIFMGKKYFKTVYEVEIDQLSRTGDGTGDQLEVGIGAYTDVWVSLANKPIKWGSETSVTANGGDALTRDTGFYIDYFRGKIKAIAGGGIAAGDTVTISYTKGQLWLDLSDLADLIRVQRVEYPVGDIPQSIVPWDIWGKILIITGGPEQAEQDSMAKDKHIRVYFDAEHQPPTDYSPGSIPEFLENTIIMAAGAYALLVEALQHEHQTATDLASTRSALGTAMGTHSALALVLADIDKYLDGNEDNADAAGMLADITTFAASLRTAITEALAQANAYLDAVASDLTNANSIISSYSDYINGTDTAPSVAKYLSDGDEFLNKITVGGEQQAVPAAYRQYAEATRTALISVYEEHRRMYLQAATARTNAALAYTQEAAQRTANLRSYIEQSAGYSAIASIFAREAEIYISRIQTYLAEASGYTEAAGGDLVLADRYRTEALERRNEVLSIWRDRKQYIGDFTMGSIRQMPTYGTD